MSDNGHTPAAANAERAARGKCFRTGSFYLLWAIPIVLVLSLHTFLSKSDPQLFAFGLATLFVFIGVILARACIDIFEILRGRTLESMRDYRETLGASEFTGALGARLRERSFAKPADLAEEVRE